ncbi:MAG: amidohydrolase family protein [Gammaproteobacteria bacterium]|nr:amidohydrolase family protein [Gammaproteobacteria bacterium]MXW44960.1 amidohydrolase [Gammaproteobacteria bacterium]MYD02558.1 amidohydrolase [Gammaproteobacteria bacterium]MYI25327.1 amidohydrolase [Gammaproteobacteria bacterium]
MKLCIVTRTLIVVAALSVTGWSVEAGEMGVAVNGERLAVIDMHLHTGTWVATPPRFRKRLTGRVPPGFKWTMGIFMDRLLTGEKILDTLDDAGISSGAVFALWSPATAGIASNDHVAEQVAVAPGRLFGFASLRVDHWAQDGPEQLRQMEEAIDKHGMVGIKVAHGHQQFRLDDRRFYGIYEIAARRGTPIYLHTGTSPNPGTRTEPPYCDPAYLEEAVKQYPGAVFVLGHSGYDSFNRALTYTDSAIDLARRYPNVYLEPGALGAERAELVLHDYLERIRAGGVIDKLLYGSDGPQFPGYVKSHLEAFVAGMLEVGYTTDEMRRILADNFSRVFGMPKIVLEEQGS